MKKRSVSLTGATGFVGWHVAEAFLRDGWAVRAIVRRGNRKPVPPGAMPVESELAAEALTEAAAGSDVLVHSAALVRAKDDAAFNAVNVQGTAAAVAAASRAGARFILISSQAAAGEGTRDDPRRESDPPAPLNAYGRSKLASEDVVRASQGLRWTILRPSAVYGPRDAGFLPLFRMARRGLFLVPPGGSTWFTLLDVRDLARAILLAADADAAVGETLFLGHAVPQTGDDVLMAIAASAGRTFRPARVPAPIFAAAATLGDLLWKVGITPVVDSGRLIELRARGFVCSVERARAVLGFTAETELRDGIARTARWYAEHGWL